METVIYARLDQHAEREVIAAARRSVTIAYTDDENADRARRSLGGLAQGDTVSMKRLGVAAETLRELLSAIEIDLRHFRRMAEKPPADKVTLPAGAVPVIADPRQMATVLVESREKQQAEVLEALTMVRRMQAAILGEQTEGAT